MGRRWDKDIEARRRRVLVWWRWKWRPYDPRRRRKRGRGQTEIKQSLWKSDTVVVWSNSNVKEQEWSNIAWLWLLEIVEQDWWSTERYKSITNSWNIGELESDIESSVDSIGGSEFIRTNFRRNRCLIDDFNPVNWREYSESS